MLPDVALQRYSPQVLELTAADVLLAAENMDLLRQNGFDVELDDDASGTGGTRLKLVALPMSKSTVFDINGFSLFIFGSIDWSID